MTSVKYFHSAMPNAPVLNGTAGSLINVLDACLVNGFGLAVVDTLTVTDGIATATMSLGHSFEPDTVALIAGASVPSLNGQFRVLTTTVNTITFATAAPNGSATGTMSARLAPAGWEKAFSGTNLAAYRSLNMASTRCFLRVDDTGAIDGRVVGYESMTDVNTGTGIFPTNLQQSGGLFWPKANSTATTPRAWTIIADDRTFWYWANTHGTTASFGANGGTYGFGDFASFKSGDAYACCVMGHTATAGAAGSALTTVVSFVQAGVFATTHGCFAPRSWTAIGGSILCDRVGGAYAAANAYSGDTNNPHPYPNGPNNALFLNPMTLREPSGTTLRGLLRGPTFAPQNIPSTAFNWRDQIDGQGVYAGRKLMVLKGNSPASTTTSAVTQFFDITGPWE